MATRPPRLYHFQFERGSLLLITHWLTVLIDMTFPSPSSHLHYIQLSQVVIHGQKVREWEPHLEHI